MKILYPYIVLVFLFLGIPANSQTFTDEYLDSFRPLINKYCYLGELTVADSICNQLIKISKENNLEYYTNFGYVEKILINTYWNRADSVYKYRKKLKPELMDDKANFHYNSTLYLYYFYMDQKKMADEYLQTAMKLGEKSNDKYVKSIWYNRKIYYYRFQVRDTLPNTKVYDEYVSGWEALLPHLNEASLFQYYKVKLYLPPYTEENKKLIYSQLKDLCNKYKYDYFYATYYLFSFYDGNPLEGTSVEDQLNLLNKAKYYLNKTDVVYLDEYLFAAYIKYYKKTNNYHEITKMQDEIFQKNLANGDYDLVLELISAYDKLGYKDSALDLAIKNFNDYKTKKGALEGRLEAEVISGINEETHAIQDQRRVEKTRFYYYIGFAVLVILFIILIIIHQIRTSKKLAVLNNKLAINNDYLDDFMSMASHDLRSPIGTILSLTSLTDDYCTNEEIEENNQLIHELSIKSLGIISGLIVHNNLKNNIPYDMKLLNVGHILESDRRNIEFMLKSKDIDYQIQYESDLWVFGNTHLLFRLSQNLINNAAKFRSTERERSIIKVTVFLNNDGNIQWDFWDNGLGIAKDKLSSIFEKKFKIDNRSSGSGLGLAFCVEIVEYHHGTFTVDSEEGKWTCFSVTFPVLNQDEIAEMSNDSSTILNV